MKVLVLLVVLTAAAEASLSLRDILRSPRATLQLYQNYKLGEGLEYPISEDRLRYSLFVKNAEFVAAANANPEDTAHYSLNFFSSLTEEEKEQYLGLNVTGHVTGHEPAPPRLTSLAGVPSLKLWTSEGAVTPVKSQGSCGSCWSFGAVGGLETRYKEASGRLRNLAEQEWLDCVYESNKYRDGCNGGWNDDCYQYSAGVGGRLAPTADYSYTHQDGACLSGSKPNALISHKIKGTVNVAGTEDAHIAALASGSLALAVEVTRYSQSYRGGILRDTSCRGDVNHAVTGVGYTPSYVLVKNSWGRSWGDKGFVKFSRGHHNCNLFKYGSYPELESLGQKDSGASDPATNYTPGSNDDVIDPDCYDSGSNCERQKEKMCKLSWANVVCKKTCGFC